MASPTALPGDERVDRWTVARKAEVLARIRAHEITAGEAMRRWGISVEELNLWMQAERRGGRAALSVKSIPQGRLL